MIVTKKVFIFRMFLRPKLFLHTAAQCLQKKRNYEPLHVDSRDDDGSIMLPFRTGFLFNKVING